MRTGIRDENGQITRQRLELPNEQVDVILEALRTLGVDGWQEAADLYTQLTGEAPEPTDAELEERSQ